MDDIAALIHRTQTLLARAAQARETSARTITRSMEAQLRRAMLAQEVARVTGASPPHRYHSGRAAWPC